MIEGFRIIVLYYSDYIPSPSWLGFLIYRYHTQIGGELMKKAIAITLAAAGVVFICAKNCVKRKEVKYRVG